MAANATWLSKPLCTSPSAKQNISSVPGQKDKTGPEEEEPGAKGGGGGRLRMMH